VIGNFATTLDGVVSLQAKGRAGGGEITGFDPHDRLLMGVLRAVADVVMVGAGTLRAVPRHQWTAQHVYPAMSKEYAELRRRLGKPAFPLTVIVTARGDIDVELPVFTSGDSPVLVVTTATGARRIAKAGPAAHVRVVPVRRSGRVPAVAILKVLRAENHPRLILVEGGPQLIGDFFAEGLLEELFLTLAPQVAGRAAPRYRPGLVEGRTFAPDDPLWGSLIGARRGGSHLFLRFGFGHAGTQRKRRRLD
jgi:riboflavin biosynthesis pyrimidine reductase